MLVSLCEYGNNKLAGFTGCQLYVHRGTSSHQVFKRNFQEEDRLWYTVRGT